MNKIQSALKKYLALALCILFSISLYAVDRDIRHKFHALHPTLENIPIAPFGDTLFIIHTGMGSFSAIERAKSIEDKIKMLGNNLRFNEDSLKVVESRDAMSIVYQRSVIMSIDSLQANVDGKTIDDVAHAYRSEVVRAVYEEHENTSWQQLLLQIAGTVAIIVSVYFILKGIQYLYRRIRVK